MRPFYVYILKCRDNSYYVGHTDNIENRVSQHHVGKADGYTATRLPIRIMFVHEFTTRGEAIDMEQRIKGWSRKKKEALIAGNYELLPALSKKVFKKKEDLTQPFDTPGSLCSLGTQGER